MEKIDWPEEIIANQKISRIKSVKEKINIPNNVRVSASVTIEILAMLLTFSWVKRD